MKASTMAAAATVLVGILAAGTPVRADEDCDNVVKALEDAQLVATKTVDQTMDDIKKATGQPADDKTEGLGQEHVLQRERGISRNDAGVSRGRGRMPHGQQEELDPRLARQVDQGNGNRDRGHLQVMAVRAVDRGDLPVVRAVA